MYFTFVLPIFLSLRLVSSHAALWHPSMWGYNVTDNTFSYDNRPVVPLMHRTFEKWWFHGHLDYPPHKEDVFELPAGHNISTQIACDKSATVYWPASSSGGNIQDTNKPNDVCPGRPMTQYHTKSLDDVKGCALAIAYKSDASQVQPDDFTIFSVNQTCVWNRYTDFSVPRRMPPCPNNMCTCAWFWIHSADAGSEQMYMNGFQCRVTNSTSNVGLATPKVARRCGADQENGKQEAVLGNCTYGAKQPLYWFQDEQNNMFEGTYSPPFYNDLYNFKDGAQSDIFQDSYTSIPVPGPNQTALPALTDFDTTLSTDSSGSSETQQNVSTSIASATTPPSTAPSSSTNSQCVTKRSGSAFSLGHDHAKRGPTTFLRHKMFGMARRRRPLSLERNLNLWKPF